MKDEFGAFIFIGNHFQTPAMPLRDNIIRQTQPQSRALSSRLCGEKGLEDFLADGFRDAEAIVLYLNQDLIVNFLGGNGDGGLVRWGTREGCHYGASATLSNRIKCIVDQIQQFPPNVLWNDGDQW